MNESLGVLDKYTVDIERQQNANMISLAVIVSGLFIFTWVAIYERCTG